MGSGRWDPGAWATYASSTIGAPTSKIYASRELKKELDPLGVTVRESRDSADNLASTPICVGIDVTGSMGMIADALAREGLGTLFKEILDRKPVTDPHLMFMAIGDANYDQAPLQVSQYEADARIIEQLTGIWIEHGGGGNENESYSLAWYFAAQHTALDAFEKRGKKGYLFTVGDEEPSEPLTPDQLKRFVGDDIAQAVSAADALRMAEETYRVFHIVVEQGSHARGVGADRVVGRWTDLMGQRVLRLSDYQRLSEVIVSTIQVAEGADRDTVSASWKGDTSLVVAKALAGVVATAGVAAPPVTRF